jgi:hypothetical protein
LPNLTYFAVVIEWIHGDRDIVDPGKQVFLSLWFSCVQSLLTMGTVLVPYFDISIKKLDV